MGLGLVQVRLKVSIGVRVRVSFFGPFRVRVRGGVRFWLGPGTRLDPQFSRVRLHKTLTPGTRY